MLFVNNNNLIAILFLTKVTLAIIWSSVTFDISVQLLNTKYFVILVPKSCYSIYTKSLILVRKEQWWRIILR
jgi:hypothetical protein